MGQSSGAVPFREVAPMPEEYITREVHNEFAKRVEEENSRQNHRLTELEETVKNISKLTVAVQKLAVNMDRMLEEQKETSSRISALEREPGDRWRKLIDLLIAGAAGFLLSRIGLG